LKINGNATTVDVARTQPGHLEGRVRGACRLGARERRALRQLERGLAVAEAEHRHRLRHAERAGALRAHHDDRAAAVGHQRAVVAAQRIDDPGRGQVRVHRQRRAQLRVGVVRTVAAAGDRHRAEVLGPRAVLDHVPAVDHRVAGRRRQPAVGRVVAARPRVHGAVPAARVVRVAHQRDLALPGLDRHDRERQQCDVGRAALVPGTAEARRDAQRLGDLLAVHELVGRRGHLDEHRVDHRFVDARVLERRAAGLDVQRHGIAPRQLAEARVADAGDHVAAAQVHVSCP
jgi:hypothetical protein